MVPLTASGSVCSVPSRDAYSFRVFLAKASNLRPASVINTPFLSRIQSLVFNSSSSLFRVLLKVDGLTWHSEAVLVRFEVSHSLKNVAASFRSSTLFSLSIKFQFDNKLRYLQYETNYIPFFKKSVIMFSPFRKEQILSCEHLKVL